MQINHLRTFVTVVEREGFSAAAQVLGISQPAVSQQIRRLETELGVELLRRGRRAAIELTVFGEILLDFARTTLAAYNDLCEELYRRQSIIEGKLWLAASTTPGEYLVPQLLADFRAQYPAVEAQVTVGDTASVVQQVLAGECDLGFIGAPVEQPSLVLERLTADQVVLAVYPAHPFASRESVTWQEVQAQPLILREEGSGTRQTVLQALAVRGQMLPPASVALTLGSTQAIVQAIRDGLGVGFVSQRAIARVPPTERLPTVAVEGLTFTRELFIIYNAAQIKTPLLHAFLAFVRQRYSAAGLEPPASRSV